MEPTSTLTAGLLHVLYLTLTAAVASVIGAGLGFGVGNIIRWLKERGAWPTKLR